MKREDMMSRLAAPGGAWDVVVIGGGATGLGCAVDAALRGYRTALFDRGDFACGTSSRSTKLIHGGVRYLRRGNVALVLESLHERGVLRANAPHLVHDLEFVVPTYDWWEGPFYGVGLRLYDLLAGRYGFGRSRNLSREETIARIPTIATDGLRGGVVYYDGQFDDARLAVALARTAADLGALVVNYVEVTGLVKKHDLVSGVSVRDVENGRSYRVEARAVINAAGVHVDAVRRLDDAAADPMIRASRGTHIVLDGAFLPGKTAVMVPQTDDGRVLFAIPWLGRALVGTTDVAVDDPGEPPRASRAEIAYLLSHLARYVHEPPAASDIRSVFAGHRPLVDGGESDTASIARDHHVVISPSGLVTIAGGKWTTYRRMAQDAVDQAAAVAGLPEVACATASHAIHGATGERPAAGALVAYGSDAGAIEALAAGSSEMAADLCPSLGVTGAVVAWAVEHEMARTLEDVLARRTRALALDARAAAGAAPAVAERMRVLLGRGAAWASHEVERFREVAGGSLPDAPFSRPGRG